MLLKDIAWPVYSMGNKIPSIEGKVSFTSTQTAKGITLHIIDDKSIEGNTLAERRLKLLVQNIPLFKFKYTLFFLSDLIKLAKPNKWFIDSLGRLFQYKKQSTAKLVFKKITNIIRGVGIVLIELEGSSNRYSCLYPPTPEQKYAGVLKIGGANILYGFYEVQHKNTYRRV